MPEEITKEAIQFLGYLLPGFLAAWVFYGLTSHSKPSQFERVVQALIFTFIIQVFIPGAKWLLEVVGKYIPLGSWDNAAEGLTSFFLALVFGAVLAYLANNDTIHKWLRKIGFTTRTSHPSEWFYVLSDKVMFVILHLNDGRRLYGWPKEWPIESDKGQFYIMMPSWIQADGNQIDLPQLDGILINAVDVKWVEFVLDKKESQ
ncbi:MAG: DUF6338 family protein [Candidatus Thiodiazotropha taylori]|nr:DUF6338 family protein [Candidatus Thiodiazotropha taylori]